MTAPAHTAHPLPPRPTPRGAQEQAPPSASFAEAVAAARAVEDDRSAAKTSDPATGSRQGGGAGGVGPSGGEQRRGAE